MNDEETNSSAVVVLTPDVSTDQMLNLVGLEPDRKWNLNDPITQAGKGRRPGSGLVYESLLEPDRPIDEHVHALAQRLAPARARFLNLKRSFSRERRGSIQLTVFIYRPTADAIEFLLDVDDMAFFADICTSLSVSVVGDQEAISGSESGDSSHTH